MILMFEFDIGHSRAAVLFLGALTCTSGKRDRMADCRPENIALVTMRGFFEHLASFSSVDAAVLSSRAHSPVIKK